MPLINVWGHDLEIEDIENSIVLPMLIEDMAMDLTGSRGLDPAPKTILDVGANVGVYSMLMAKAYPESRIMAIEPLPNNLRCLESNLRKNGVEGRILTRQLAISNRKGAVPIFQHPINSGSASIFNRTDWPVFICRGVTLNHLVNMACRAFKVDKIDLVKMDVEGSEYLAIPTFKEWEKIERFTIELHGVSSFGETQSVEMAHKLLDMIRKNMKGKDVFASIPNSLNTFSWGEWTVRSVNSREQEQPPQC